MRFSCFLALLLAVPSLSPADDPTPADWAGLKFHAPPKPLPQGAVTSEWPHFLGPDHQPISPETKLLAELPEQGPSIVWECEKGEGYTCPTIADGRLVLFHRIGDDERIDCLDPLTGKRYWSHAYPIEYRDRYGYSDGPRASPTISHGRVFTFGVTSLLHSLDLKTGRVLWKRDCAKEDQVPQYFFGSGATPLVIGELVILNLGGEGAHFAAAYDVASGIEKWRAKHAWGQSYASPIPVSLSGKERVAFFAGGESRPSTGGLISLDPLTGKIEGEFPWRAERYTSVNASSPVRFGKNQIFITQGYTDEGSPCNGGALVEWAAEGEWKLIWKNDELACHWMTPVYDDGHLYAFVGEKEGAAELVCHRAADGKKLWGSREEWDVAMAPGKLIPVGFKRGGLLKVDGRMLALGEWGSLAWLEVTPAGCVVRSKTQLFLAEHTWTLPTLSQGLLYVCQHTKDEISQAPARLICYDLRAAETAKTP